MEKLEVGGVIIPYTKVYSNRAKRLRITVIRDKVTLTIPKGSSVEDAMDFLETKKNWVLKHVQKYKNQMLTNIKKKFISGEKFLYLGKELTLRIVPTEDIYTTIKLESKTIWVFMPNKFSKESWPEITKEALTYCYKNQAKKIFKERLDYFQKSIGVEYKDFKVKDQKTRWGSCSRKGNINLNWRIIMAPSQVIDYLIIHELSHIIHMNHSKEFWCLVARHMPQYEKSKKWLKENGKKLFF